MGRAGFVGVCLSSPVSEIRSRDLRLCESVFASLTVSSLYLCIHDMLGCRESGTPMSVHHYPSETDNTRGEEDPLIPIEVCHIREKQ